MTWLKAAIAPLTLVAVTAAANTSAVAATQCNTRSSVVSQLADEYGEQVTANAVTHNGTLLEVLTTLDGGTWSIIITSPRGQSCLVAAGEGWRAIAPAPDGPEA